MSTQVTNRKRLPSELCHELNSSALAGFGYDPQAAILEVLMHNGRAYQYDNVPEWVAERLGNANSAGQYYNMVIKVQYGPAEEVSNCPIRPSTPRPLPTAHRGKLKWEGRFCQYVATYGEWSAVVLELPGAEASLLLFLGSNTAHTERGFADVKAAQMRAEEILLPEQ